MCVKNTLDMRKITIGKKSSCASRICIVRNDNTKTFITDNLSLSLCDSSE